MVAWQLVLCSARRAGVRTTLQTLALMHTHRIVPSVDAAQAAMDSCRPHAALSASSSLHATPASHVLGPASHHPPASAVPTSLPWAADDTNHVSDPPPTRVLDCLGAEAAPLPHPRLPVESHGRTAGAEPESVEFHGPAKNGTGAGRAWGEFGVALDMYDTLRAVGFESCEALLPALASSLRRTGASSASLSALRVRMEADELSLTRATAEDVLSAIAGENGMGREAWVEGQQVFDAVRGAEDEGASEAMAASLMRCLVRTAKLHGSDDALTSSSSEGKESGKQARWLNEGLARVQSMCERGWVVSGGVVQHLMESAEWESARGPTTSDQAMRAESVAGQPEDDANKTRTEFEGVLSDLRELQRRWMGLEAQSGSSDKETSGETLRGLEKDERWQGVMQGAEDGGAFRGLMAMHRRMVTAGVRGAFAAAVACMQHVRARIKAGAERKLGSAAGADACTTEATAQRSTAGAVVGGRMADDEVGPGGGRERIGPEWVQSAREMALDGATFEHFVQCCRYACPLQVHSPLANAFRAPCKRVFSPRKSGPIRSLPRSKSVAKRSVHRTLEVDRSPDRSHVNQLERLKLGVQSLDARGDVLNMM